LEYDWKKTGKNKRGKSSLNAARQLAMDLEDTVNTCTTKKKKKKRRKER